MKIVNPALKQKILNLLSEREMIAWIRLDNNLFGIRYQFPENFLEDKEKNKQIIKEIVEACIQLLYLSKEERKELP